MSASLLDSVVVVTGANGGLGAEFVQQALDRGARKVYATARRPHDWDDDRIVPVELDLTDQASVDSAFRRTSDASILVNNAGVYQTNNALLSNELDETRRMFETNFFGTLRVTRAYAPTLAQRHGAILNVLSVLSWSHTAGSYSATKAALWSASDSMRRELHGRVQVTALHMFLVDTPLVRGVAGNKADPADIVLQAYDGLEHGDDEVLGDDWTRRVRLSLSH